MKLFVPPYNIDVTRKKIHSVRLRITSDGALKLSIPTHVPLDEAERFVRSHLSWIEKKLEEQQSTPICDDENEPMIFGRPYITEILPCAREYAIFSDDIMTIHTNTPKDEAKIKALAEQCILYLVQERAEHYLRHYATLLGVEVPPLSLSQNEISLGQLQPENQAHLIESSFEQIRRALPRLCNGTRTLPHSASESQHCISCATRQNHAGKSRN